MENITDPVAKELLIMAHRLIALANSRLQIRPVGALPPLPNAAKRPHADRAMVKATRLRAGLTIAQAAVFIGVAKRTWEAWEGGHRNMATEIFDRFKRGLRREQ